MPTKAELYAQMADKVATQLTGSWQEWAGFLTTASRLYKYPFHEQLMIYAQRPDATACAEYDLWNEKMGRYVRRGSKGIALVDDSGDRPRLRYVFDISDTGTREHSRTPWLWQLEERHLDSVQAMFERTYDVSGDDLAGQLTEVAGKLAEEYWTEHQQDFFYIVDGSFLEEYDEYNIGVQFKAAATVSITYALMSRCGLEPERYFDHEDFMAIFDFNTPSTIGALGTAVSQINQQVLRQIGVTVRNAEREANQERSKQDEQSHDLYPERRLSDSRPEAEPAAGETPGQVRKDEENLSEGTPSHPLQPDVAEREAVPAPSGDRRDRPEQTGTDDAPAGEGSGSHRGTESQRSHEVGGADEHLQSPGRGNPDGGAYQQLTLNLFLSEAEQIQSIDEAENVAHTSSAFSFAQNDIDHVLRLGGNTDRQRERVVAAFEKQKTTAEIVEILKTLYHGGNGLGSVSAWYAEDGIHLSHGKSVRYDRSAQVISWESAAERIGELLESGQFASNVELAEAAGYERSLLATKFWNLYHDLSEDAREAEYLSCLSEIKGNGFPEETRRLTEQLSDPAFRQTLKEEYAAFWTAYQQDRDLLRFHYHKPREIWENLKDLDLPRRTFSSDLSQVPTVQHFITEDEIDAAMTGGSSFAGGKGRIYAFFMENHTDKEKVRFLKDEYGIGGRSHALSGATHSGEDHDGKGLHYKKQDCPDVHLNWEKVAKRITSLVQKGRYLTEQEQAQYDKIQTEKELAEEDAIQAQQPEVEEETPKPTLREQFEQYKPVVTAAISEDAAYRNACGHSDRENAVIEGNAAVRRAVLGSKDMELIRLYSDIPEFRQRLHREVIDETYPKLHELLRPLSQEDINTALCAWNGNIESKHAVVPLPEQEPAFTVYDDIRQKLIVQGMPADQIAFIHEANTEVRKKELFSKVRTGQVRVLMGSTAKMGAGTNVQDRLVALHDLDCPWRPGDLAQRKGRIERQGNQNPLVHVYRYVTEGTFDAYLWQTVENKQKFISQIMTSKSPVRSCEDVDETALSFAEIKALCAGDPRIKERMDLDVEVSRLKLMKADHQSKQYRLEDQLLKYFPEEIEKHKGFIKGFESDLEVLAAHPHPEDGFSGMEIRGDLLTDKENAGAALLDACKEVKTSDPVQIGSYRGYAMSVEFSAWKQEYTLLLKGQMTHRATLGTDPRGNLTRIDNALAQMPQRLEAAKAQLDNLCQQQAAAKEEVGKPFLYEEELRSKNARLVELDTLLNIDGKGPAHAEAVVAKSTRPSVLDSLKRPVLPRSTDKKPKQHEEVR